MALPPQQPPAPAPGVPAANPPAPVDVFWTFAGPLDQASSGRFNQQVPLMMSMPAHAAHHLSIQTAGGTVGDGIWLYNFFRTFPRNLIVYNTGTIASIGTIAYLGAPQRTVSAHAAFMIHRTTLSPLPPTATNLAVATKVLAIEDQRTEAILRERARLTEAHWRQLDHHDLWLTAQEALDVGVATDIGEFVPRHDGTLFVI